MSWSMYIMVDADVSLEQLAEEVARAWDIELLREWDGWEDCYRCADPEVYIILSKDEGCQIVGIGRSPARESEGIEISPYYEMELREILERMYPWYSSQPQP